MISIKDYAKENGVSYEAVRQQIARYSSELEGHIHKQGRTRFLDDEAVAFLQEHRLKEPVAIYQGAPDAARIKELEDEIEHLKQENKGLYKALNQAKDKIIEMQDEREQLKLDKQELQHLLESPKEQEKPQKKGILGWIFG